MSKEQIALKLKKYREQCGLSVKDVQQKLALMGFSISDKTIYGYESGHRQPDADTLMAMCVIYGIDDVFSAFGYKDTDDEENNEENSEGSDEMWRLRDELRTRPEMQVLFSLSKKATKEDIEIVTNILKSLQKDSKRG